MTFIDIVSQISRNVYFPWYLVDVLVGSVVVSFIIFEIFRIRHHHRRIRR